MWIFSTNLLPSFFPTTKSYGPICFDNVDDGPSSYRRILKSPWAGGLGGWFLAGRGKGSWLYGSWEGSRDTSSNSFAGTHSTQLLKMGLFQISKHAWAVYPWLSSVYVFRPWEWTSAFMMAMAHDPHLSAGLQAVNLGLSAIWKEARNLSNIIRDKVRITSSSKACTGSLKMGLFQISFFLENEFLFSFIRST